MKIESLGIYESQADRQQYEVIRYTDQITFKSTTNPRRKVDGLRSYKTQCGIQLNADSDDESRFKTVNDDEVLVKV